MEWADVYTERQKRELITATKRVLQDLLTKLTGTNFHPEEEIEIAGYYGAVADKLVVTKDGVIAVRVWSYEADPNANPPKPQYLYRPMWWEQADAIIRDFSLTPRHFAEAERKIAQQTQETRRKKGLSPEEKAATVAALRALFESRACWVGSLLREITLGRSRCPTKEWWGGNILEYHYLIIDCYGIWESSPIGRGRIGRDHNGRTFAGGNLEELVELYDLSAEKLLKIKAMIEAE